MNSNSPAFCSHRDRRRLAAVMFVMITWLPRLSDRAAADDAKKETAADAPVVISGKVEDGSGKAVAGARITANIRRWVDATRMLETLLETETRQIASLVTDHEGRFDVQIFPAMRRGAIGFQVVALAENGTLGFATARSDRNADVTIILQQTGTFRGKLTTPDGKPIPGARIIPDLMSDKPIANTFRRPAEAQLPKDLIKKFTATTSETGEFEIVGAPTSGNLIGDIDMGETGTVRASWDVSEPVTIRLEEPGAMRFQLYVGAEKKQIDQIRISIETDPFGTKRTPDSHFFVWSPLRTAAFEKDGIVEFRGLVPGRFHSTLQIGSGVRVVALEPGLIRHTVKSAATVETPVPLLPAYPIRGRVKVATGAPVANAFVTVLQDALLMVNQVRTNETGEFQALAPEGEILIHASRSDNAFVQYLRKEDRARGKTITIRPTDKPIEVPDVTLDEESKGLR